jgi:hypothetical protein
MAIIAFYADDDSMGNLSAAQCDQFRSWACEEIAREYKGFVAVVYHESYSSHSRVDFEGMEGEIEDEYAARAEIEEFCARLWDRCPWDESMDAKA